MDTRVDDRYQTLRLEKLLKKSEISSKQFLFAGERDDKTFFNWRCSAIINTL